MTVKGNIYDATVIFRDHKSLQRNLRFRLALPVLNTAYTVPWGYDVDAEDSSILMPVDSRFKSLKIVIDRMNELTWVEMANYLTYHGNQSISPWGLQKVVETRKPFPEAYLPLEDRMALLKADIY